MPAAVVGVIGFLGQLSIAAQIAIQVGVGIVAISAGKAIIKALTPDMGSADAAASDQQLSNSGTPVERFIVGEAVVSGQIIKYDKVKANDKEYHHFFIPLAMHECDEVLPYQLDGKAMTSFTGEGYYFQPRLGTQTSALSRAVSSMSNVDSSFVGYGVTDLYGEIVIDGNIFPNGLQDLKVKVRGMKLYDPRKDTTAGGLGAHRIDNPSTWEWTDNAALVNFWWKVFGDSMQLPLEMFSMANIAEEANICDIQVDYLDPDGNTQTQAQYTCNGTINTTDSHESVEEQLLSSCGGRWIESGGQFRLQVAAFRGPASIIITEDDIKGSPQRRPSTPLSERCNVVKASFISKHHFFQATDMTPLISTFLQNGRDEGRTFEHDLDFRFVNDNATAQRLSNIHLNRNAAGDFVSLQLGHKGLRCAPGKVVSVQLTKRGIVGTYLVDSCVYDANEKSYKIQATETSADIYNQGTTPAIGDVAPNNVIDNTVCEPIEGLAFVQTVVVNRAGYISWTHPVPSSVSGYEITLTDNTSAIVERPSTIKSTILDIKNVGVGAYIAHVVAINGFGRRSTVKSISFTITEIADPQGPRGETGTPGSTALNVGWATADLALWDKVPSSRWSIQEPIDAPTISTVLQLTGAGYQELFSEVVTLDPDKKYRVSGWFKQLGGTSNKSYLLVDFIDANGDSLNNTTNPSDASGWGGIGTYHYWGYANSPLDSQWTFKKLEFGADGWASIPSGAVKMRIGGLLFYSGTANETIQISNCRVEEVAIDGVNGQNAFTLVNSANCEIGPNRVTKVSGFGSWNAGAYTKEKFVTASVSFSASSNAAQIMAGLSNDSGAAAGYTTIDYAIYFATTQIQIYEFSNDRGVFGTYTTDDIFSVVCDGHTVTYYKNGEFLYESGVTPTEPLRFDCSLINSGLENITFSAAGKKGDKGPAPTVTDLGNGQVRITGENGSVIVNDGNQGPPPTITDNGDGTVTIANSLGQSVVVSDGYTPQLGIDYFDGIDGSFVSRVYKTNETKPATPTGGSFNGSAETLPTGVSDNPIYSAGKITWVSETRYTQAANGTWSNSGWSEFAEHVIQGPKGDTGPAPTVTDLGNGQVRITGENGSVIVNDGNQGPPPTITDNGDGTVTIANSLGQSVVVSDGYTPQLGIDYFDGESGDYVSLIFKNAQARPATPTGGSYDGTVEVIPTGWSDLPSDYVAPEKRWFSINRYVNNPRTGVWSIAGSWPTARLQAESGEDGAPGAPGADAPNSNVVRDSDANTPVLGTSTILSVPNPGAGTFKITFSVSGFVQAEETEAGEPFPVGTRVKVEIFRGSTQISADLFDPSSTGFEIYQNYAFSGTINAQSGGSAFSLVMTVVAQRTPSAGFYANASGFLQAEEV